MRLQQFVAKAADPDDGGHALEAARIHQPAQIVGQPCAVALAHDDVADQHVVVLARQRADRLDAAAQSRHPPVAQRQEHVLQVRALDGVVFDEKDPSGRAGFGFRHR
ncbi:hypothetical protein D3C72_1268580 [compost metagenome]